VFQYFFLWVGRAARHAKDKEAGLSYGFILYILLLAIYTSLRHVSFLTGLSACLKVGCPEWIRSRRKIKNTSISMVIGRLCYSSLPKIVIIYLATWIPLRASRYVICCLPCFLASWSVSLKVMGDQIYLS